MLENPKAPKGKGPHSLQGEEDELGPLRRVASHALLDLCDQEVLAPKQIVFKDGSPDLGYSFGYHSTQGRSSKMEDRVLVMDLTSRRELQPCSRAVVMGVFDGHAGHEAADYLAATFVPRLLASEELSTRGYGPALRQALMACESEFLAAHCISGSTALVALMVDTNLYLANVGDCRAVVCDDAEARALTRDHKPSSNELEKQRLQNLGAQLSADGYVQLAVEGCDCADIMLSRALGGAHIKLGSLDGSSYSRGPSDSGGPAEPSGSPLATESATAAASLISTSITSSFAVIDYAGMVSAVSRLTALELSGNGGAANGVLPAEAGSSISTLQQLNSSSNIPTLTQLNGNSSSSTLTTRSSAGGMLQRNGSSGPARGGILRGGSGSFHRRGSSGMLQHGSSGPLANVVDASSLTVRDSIESLSVSGIVIPDPDIFHYAIHQESEFLILASDGVWDKVHNPEAVNRVRRWLDQGCSPSEAAEKLADYAIKLGSSDNVSAIVLRFSSRPLPPLMHTTNSVLRRVRSELNVTPTVSESGAAPATMDQPPPPRILESSTEQPGAAAVAVAAALTQSEGLRSLSSPAPSALSHMHTVVGTLM